MEPSTDVLPTFHTGIMPEGHKRLKVSKEKKSQRMAFHTSLPGETEQKKQKSELDVIDFSDPSALINMLDDIDSGEYGSVTKVMETLSAQNMKLLGTYAASYPTLFHKHWVMRKFNYQEPSPRSAKQNVIDLEDTFVSNNTSANSMHVVVLDSDDEGSVCPKNPFPKLEEVVALNNPASESKTNSSMCTPRKRKPKIKEEKNSPGLIETEHSKGVFVGVEEDMETEVHSLRASAVDDGLGDIWKEMSFALECSKDTSVDPASGELKDSNKVCDHSFVLKDDIGYFCRVCGVIDKGIDTIIEYTKNSRSKAYRSYPSGRGDGETTHALPCTFKTNEHNLVVTDISAHPRHMKQMKPHQVEGFNFLLSNLVSDNPGGCILAHAPGSGKTFMIISFMQSFLAKYPFAKPLVVLPKGILSTWKKEFQRWQIEDLPLLDFYSVKAENRPQQLEVLQKWVDQKSILFLGYKQFSTIICSDETGKISSSCEEILLKAPSILILDEGHTPRNENTDVLQSLAKIQTPRKVVLSGTLYQNNVKEVFNILNLVRPRFLKTETSRAVVKRIMSRAHIAGLKKQVKTGADVAFYDVVEYTLHKDDDFNRKVTVIRDLREMTSKVLHYYRGDFLDELPGLIDFTVLLNLSSRQRSEVAKLNKFGKFKVSSIGSALYLHPRLVCFHENSSATDSSIDEILEKLDMKDGVKAKFFLNLLGLCDSANEKLLVFSQYLLTLKFLERLVVKTKGWGLKREIFVISGESSAEDREWSMDRFNNSSDAKVFFGSIKACGEGISLVGASRILILDVHLNPSVTRQAISRAFRPGQVNKVYAYRLVAADSPEHKDHLTCFKKESISKMWFEWDEYCEYRNFEMEAVGINESGDGFLDSSLLKEDVRLLYRR